MSITAVVRGQVEVDRAFDSFPIKLRMKHLKRAVKAAAEPIASAGKMMLRRRTGALQDSMDVRISTKGSGGSTVRAYIGPRRGVKVPVRIVQSGAHAGQLLVAIPTRYAHLIEWGHKIVDKNGKVVGNVAPIPFMRVAWGAQGGEVALATLAKVLEEGIASEPT